MTVVIEILGKSWGIRPEDKSLVVVA